MPYTVPASFDRFSENISLSGDHKETATKRKDRLVSLLSNTFTIVEAFETGSIPRGTALKTKADLDVMVVLHYGKHLKGKTCEQVLQDVRDALGEYRTNVRKNGQAVTLYYDSWPNVDVVPAAVVYNDNQSVNRYEVPDMNTETWLPSRPRLHSTNVGKISTFKPMIRMLKHWNSEHSNLMESYHLEVLALKVCTLPFSNYPWELFNFFSEAVKLAANPLPHEGGYADDYLRSAADRKEVLKRLEAARDKAGRAWQKTTGINSDHRGAIEIWQQLFGSKFPSYG